MIATDLPLFLDAWLRLGESFNARPSDDSVRDVFGALADFDFAEVQSAMGEHLKYGEYMARPVNIRRIILGDLPDDQVIKALAIDAEKRPTPLGVIARSLVGHRVMTEGDDRAIYFAVQGVRPRLEEMRLRAHVGDFTDEEIRRIVAAGCRPSGPLAPGVPGTRAPFRDHLQRRCRDLLDQKKIAGPATATESAKQPEMTPEEKAQADKARLEAMALIRGLTGSATDPASEAQRADSLARAEREASS